MSLLVLYRGLDLQKICVFTDTVIWEQGLEGRLLMFLELMYYHSILQQTQISTQTDYVNNIHRVNYKYMLRLSN